MDEALDMHCSIARLRIDALAARSLVVYEVCCILYELSVLIRNRRRCFFFIEHCE